MKIRYVNKGMALTNHSKGYVYQRKNGGQSNVICHHPFLFNSDGSFNFDEPKENIIAVFKITKKNTKQILLSFIKKRIPIIIQQWVKERVY